MAIDQPQDLLYTVSKKLLPDLNVAFGRAHPAVDKIKNSAQKVPFTTNRTYFDIATGSPATSIHVQTGSETISSTRKQVARQGYIDPSRCIWTWNVPNQELSRCGSADDIIKLFNKYPKLASIGAGEEVARQFIRGASSAASDPDGTGTKGLCTLNADQNFVPTTTSYRGVLGYTGRTAAPDSGAGQTGTVFGIPQENAATDPATGWYHQYGSIGSMSTDGRRIINTTLQRTRYQGQTEDAVIDLMMADESTFQNMVEDMESLVWLADEIGSPSEAAQTREGIRYGKIPLYQEPEIDLSDTTAYTTAAALTGILIGLASGTWNLGFAGGNSQMATGGNFELMKPILLQDRDAWQYRMVADLNFFCDDLRRNMIVTGGAQE